jgi:glycosyltransferase involved in cell wall biosynthesis
MRSVYRETSLLVAPSQWEEAFGRVILEAQISGIPVVASDQGGIPEVLQGGGRILAATDPAPLWADAVESILADPGQYSVMSDAARSNAARADFDPQMITDRFLEILARHLADSVPS